jgi:excisionase family DNA binding protein
MEQLLTVPKTAGWLGISTKTAWKWVYERRIGVVRIGRTVRVKQSEVERLIAAGEVPAKNESSAA